jgi:hypothetical protein
MIAYTTAQNYIGKTSDHVMILHILLPIYLLPSGKILLPPGAFLYPYVFYPSAVAKSGIGKIELSLIDFFDLPKCHTPKMSPPLGMWLWVRSLATTTIDIVKKGISQFVLTLIKP